jgi:hypothetical protein
LSPPARAAASANAGAAYTRLVVRGDGWPDAKPMLAKLRPEQLIQGQVRSLDDANAMLAGLWLWHDWLDESHTISQSLHNPTGSFWHAIMHRREGDFSNAKYWYARCRHHPVLAQIPSLARETLGEAAVSTAPLHNLLADAWDPDAFVDAVEAVHRKPGDPLHDAAARLQQVEWRALFDYCARNAAG